MVSRIPTINVTLPDRVQRRPGAAAERVPADRHRRRAAAVPVAGACSRPGVLAAQHRSRALVVAGLSLAGAMLLLGFALLIGRSLYASSLPPTVQRVDTAVSIYDQFVSLLRVELRVGLVLGLLLAIIAFVAGGTTAARQLRASSSHGCRVAARTPATAEASAPDRSASGWTSSAPSCGSWSSRSPLSRSSWPTGSPPRTWSRCSSSRSWCSVWRPWQHDPGVSRPVEEEARVLV